MCNIAGAIKQDKIKYHDSMALKVLSTFGASRGKDSVGLFYDNQVQYHIKTKQYNCDNGNSNHVWNITRFPEKIQDPIVLLHNRAGTVGDITEDAAHPYVIDDNLVGIMNGTIYNYVELADKYEIEHVDYHTDSDLLFKIIHKTRSFDVLKEYNGGAALAFFWKEEPTKLYLWKGASKSWSNGKAEEERPLWYTIYKGVLYFNSEPKPLRFITNTNADLELVKDNTLLCFDRTQFISSEIFDRSEQFQTKITKNESSTYYGDSMKHYPTWPKGQRKIGSEIKEENPQSVAKGKIYYFEGWYWKNGHRVNGQIYINLGTGDCSYYPSPHYEKCWFFDGFWIKDEETYDELIASRSPGKVYIRHLHPLAMSKTDDGEYYIGNSLIPQGKFIPLFGYNTYYFNKDSKLVFCREGITESLLPAASEDTLLAHANKFFHLSSKAVYAITRREIDDLGQQILPGAKIDWTNLTTLKESLDQFDKGVIQTVPSEDDDDDAYRYGHNWFGH